jgi:hypothetical protein
MSEKRYYIKKSDSEYPVFDRLNDNNCVAVCDVERISQITCNELNALHEENQRLIKMLDNVANYMQKQHKDVPIDDFVEWWNNIATEGL